MTSSTLTIVSAIIPITDRSTGFAQKELAFPSPGDRYGGVPYEGPDPR